MDLKRIVGSGGTALVVLLLAMSAGVSAGRPTSRTRRCAGTARPCARCWRRTPMSTRRRVTARRRCTGRSTAATRKWSGVLIRAGANVKAANREGATPLWLASVERRRGHRRRAARGRRRSEREPAARPHAAHGGVAHRQCRGDESAHRPRRRREREGHAARHDADDVGGGRRPCGRHQAADRARRGHQGAIESRPNAAAGRRSANRTIRGGPSRRLARRSPPEASPDSGRAECSSAGCNGSPRSTTGRGGAARGRRRRRRRSRASIRTTMRRSQAFGGRGPGAERRRRADAAGLCHARQRSRVGEGSAGRRRRRQPGTTGYGWSPLLVATQNRYYKLGAYLLDHGADPNLANKGGWVPLYLATDNRNIESGDYPVRKGDMDHLEFIKLLLDKGANVNARLKDSTETRTVFTNQWLDENGATAFLRASPVRRPRADEAAAGARSRSEDRHDARRDGAARRRRHRLGRRHHLRVVRRRTRSKP